MTRTPFRDDLIISIRPAGIHIANRNTGAAHEIHSPNPAAFGHPRLIIGDFSLALKTLSIGARKVRRPILGNFLLSRFRNITWKIERSMDGG